MSSFLTFEGSAAASLVCMDGSHEMRQGEKNGMSTIQDFLLRPMAPSELVDGHGSETYIDFDITDDCEEHSQDALIHPVQTREKKDFKKETAWDHLQRLALQVFQPSEVLDHDGCLTYDQIMAQAARVHRERSMIQRRRYIPDSMSSLAEEFEVCDELYDTAHDIHFQDHQGSLDEEQGDTIS